jgi:hypothetical protein
MFLQTHLNILSLRAFGFERKTALYFLFFMYRCSSFDETDFKFTLNFPSASLRSVALKFNP